MKRIFIVAVLAVLSFSIYAEPIYHVNLPNGVAFINRKGEIVIDAISSFLDGYAWGLNTEFNGIGIAVLSDKKDKKYHLLTSDGEWLYASEKALVPASYTRVWEQVNETVWRLIDFDGEEYYRIDLGKDFSTTDLGYFVEGKAVVTDDTGCKVISENGDVVASLPYRQRSELWYYPGKYLDSGIFVGSNGNLMDKSLRFAVATINGQIIYGPDKVWPVGVPSEGKVFMGTGYVDVKGNRGKDGSGYFYGHHYTEGVAAVIMPGRNDPDHFYAYYINHDGEIVIDGEKLGITDARPFSDGLAAVSTRPPVPTNNVRKAMDIFNDNPFTSHLYKEGLWGAIDKNGKWVIKPKFPDPFRFDRGLALLKFDYTFTYDTVTYDKMKFKSDEGEVVKGVRYVYIDKKGKVVFDTIANLEQYLDGYSDGYSGAKVLDPGFVFE